MALRDTFLVKEAIVSPRAEIDLWNKLGDMADFKVDSITEGGATYTVEIRDVEHNRVRFFVDVDGAGNIAQVYQLRY